jgi:iron complex transport system substrate-binding protein
VGSNSQIDMERVLALKPDLVVVWHSGNTARQIAQLESLGVPIFRSEPNRLELVATSLERFGALLGTEPLARRAAGDYRSKIGQLAARYGKRPLVTVFYQVWDQPLYTLNDQQIASDIIRLCGGRNVFGELKAVAPEVGLEAVIERDPEVILAGKRYDPASPGLALWKPYSGMTAVWRNNLFTVDGDLLSRPGPRTAEGAAVLCEQLEAARRKR